MFPTRKHQHRPHAIAACAAATLLFLAPAVGGPPTVINLGVLPTGFLSEAYDVTITPAGVPVVVGSCTTPGVLRAFVWTPEAGMAELPVFAGATRPALAYAVNADASVIVGLCRVGDHDRATRWVLSREEWLAQELGILPDASGHSVALDVTADGLFPVGYSPFLPNQARAVGWDIGDAAIVNFGVMKGGTYTYAFGVSADGCAAAGQGDTEEGQRAFLWTWAEGCRSLGTLEGGAYSFASDISADGNVVVGIGDNAQGGQRGWRYDVERRSMFDLGLYPGATSVAATGVSGDGSVVVGRASIPGGFAAWLWTEETQMENLGDHLFKLGTDITGWSFQRAEAVSSDGTAIAGTGTFNGQTRAFLVTGLAGCAPQIELIGGTSYRCPGAIADFSVYLAPASGEVSYAWRFNGQPIDPATNPSAATAHLVIEDLDAGDAGAYDCVVSNACGTVTSDELVLTIAPPDDPNCGNPPCPADIDGNGVVNSADFFAFLLLFFEGIADFNRDGSTNSQDFFDYLNAFFGPGC